MTSRIVERLLCVVHVNMIMAVHVAMPKTLVMPSTGTRVVFGA